MIATPPPCAPSLAALFWTQAKRYQDRVLYRYWREGQWRSLSWNEALCQAREIALGLISLGISRGDRIALLSANRVEWQVIDWANICTGALTVPIYASSSAAQAMHIIGHADPAVLVVEDVAAKGCRRRKRAREEINRMEQLALARGVRVERPSRLAVLRTFAPAKNKYEVALRLAVTFPVLGDRLPRRRKAWMSEDQRMNTLDALGFAAAAMLGGW